MSRSTSDIVDDLRIEGSGLDRIGATILRDVTTEAADRLGELDITVEKLRAACDRMDAALKRRDALRLPCPTCGGTHLVGYTDNLCPDCTDGFMSHERAWKIVTAVFIGHAASGSFLDHLRSIR